MAFVWMHVRSIAVVAASLSLLGSAVSGPSLDAMAAPDAPALPADSAASGTNMIANGDFSAGSASWLLYATPDLSYIVADTSNGRMDFYGRRATFANQAVVFQETGLPLPAGAPVEVQFTLGSTDAYRKRITVLVHNSNFLDLAVCTFWLPAEAPIRTYRMRMRTTQAWTNATLSFYAASMNVSFNGTGAFQLDNVSMVHDATLPLTGTTCYDPLAPAPPSGLAISDVIVNGTFALGDQTWFTYGQIQSQVTNGVMEFIKNPGQPAGVVGQVSTQPMPANQIVTSTFALGNSSSVRKRVTVLVHDAAFLDLSACTFWLPPGQPLTPYQMRVYATREWSQAAVSFYPATTGPEPWIRLDDVTLTGTPGASTVGTECLENVPADQRPPQPTRSETLTVSTLSADEDPIELVDLTAAPDARWLINTTNGRRVLELADPLDLFTAARALLSFGSRLNTTTARATVEVTTDEADWETVAVVASSEAIELREIDLSPYVGAVIRLRFVLDPIGPVTDVAPAIWEIDRLWVDVK